jgi:hypothetical protein
LKQGSKANQSYLPNLNREKQSKVQEINLHKANQLNKNQTELLLYQKLTQTNMIDGFMSVIITLLYRWCFGFMAMWWLLATQAKKQQS